jgi:hypothetical protein
MKLYSCVNYKNSHERYVLYFWINVWAHVVTTYQLALLERTDVEDISVSLRICRLRMVGVRRVFITSHVKIIVSCYHAAPLLSPLAITSHSQRY